MQRLQKWFFHQLTTHNTYYLESKNLPEATADSVTRFTEKVDAFVTVHPDAQQDPLYPEIRENIQQVWVQFQITVHDEWDKEDESYWIKN